jgi:acyl carrier protein
MPAKSEAQRRLMMAALSVKTGKSPRDRASDAVKRLADTMTEEQLRDFAMTDSDKEARMDSILSSALGMLKGKDAKTPKPTPYGEGQAILPVGPPESLAYRVVPDDWTDEDEARGKAEWAAFLKSTSRMTPSEQARAALSEAVGMPAKEIGDDARMDDDLGLDEFDRFELGMTLEELLGRQANSIVDQTVSDRMYDGVEKAKTVKDVMNLFEAEHARATGLASSKEARMATILDSALQKAAQGEGGTWWERVPTWVKATGGVLAGGALIGAILKLLKGGRREPPLTTEGIALQRLNYQKRMADQMDRQYAPYPQAGRGWYMDRMTGRAIDPGRHSMLRSQWESSVDPQMDSWIVRRERENEMARLKAVTDAQRKAAKAAGRAV